eukprot:s2528_g10.t1
MQETPTFFFSLRVAASAYLKAALWQALAMCPVGTHASPYFWWCFVGCVRARRTHPTVARLGVTGCALAAQMFSWHSYASGGALWDVPAAPDTSHSGTLGCDGLRFGSPNVLLAFMPRRMLLVVLCGMCPAAPVTSHSCMLGCDGLRFGSPSALCSVGFHASPYAFGGALCPAAPDTFHCHSRALARGGVKLEDCALAIFVPLAPMLNAFMHRVLPTVVHFGGLGRTTLEGLSETLAADSGGTGEGVHPDLARFVAAELKDQASIAKEARKAREEMANRKKGGGKKADAAADGK